MGEISRYVERGVCWKLWIIVDILWQLCIMFHMYEVTATTTFMRWLNGLRDAKAQTIIAARIERVKVGNFGDCKSVGDGVSELRIAFGPGLLYGRGSKDCDPAGGRRQIHAAA